jgi:uncharacterized phage-associated protein
MISALDVAAYILKKQGPMSAMKLQKLVYYAQAWSLVWDDEPLFYEKIKAWANGPVVPQLYQAHKGQFTVVLISDGHAERLDADQQATVNEVLRFYGDKDAQWLSELTHREAPWRLARGNLPADDTTSSPEITLDSMSEYYSSLAAE